MSNNVWDWYFEDDQQGQQPPTDPGQGAPAPAQQEPQNTPDPSITNQEKIGQDAQPQPEQPDVNQDPVAPDMPEEKQDTDFESWKNQFLKESVKGDANQLMEMLMQVRDKEGLHPYQKKFVSDNWNIVVLRMNANVDKACREIRNQIRQQIDRNNPATSVVNHMNAVMATVPSLNNIFVKLNAYSGLKGDLHRKYVAALLGAVQVGSGADNEDLVYNERDYSILLSTRFNARWGDVPLGNWSLSEEDPSRYLSDPELKRMQEGSPMEKDALRRRIVVESIADKFQTRAFIINVVADDGTLYTLGWDIATSLRAAFADGKLVVKTRTSDNSEAMIDEDGNIVPLVDLSVNYVKETGGQDADGKPSRSELRFMERRHGMLFLTADLKLIQEASTALQGASFKATPYNGHPADLKALQRCVYSASDLLLRQC